MCVCGSVRVFACERAQRAALIFCILAFCFLICILFVFGLFHAPAPTVAIYVRGFKVATSPVWVWVHVNLELGAWEVLLLL
jgi:hypothetical protein